MIVKIDDVVITVEEFYESMSMSDDREMLELILTNSGNEQWVKDLIKTKVGELK